MQAEDVWRARVPRWVKRIVYTPLGMELEPDHDLEVEAASCASTSDDGPAVPVEPTAGTYKWSTCKIVLCLATIAAIAATVVMTLVLWRPLASSTSHLDVLYVLVSGHGDHVLELLRAFSDDVAQAPAAPFVDDAGVTVNPSIRIVWGNDGGDSERANVPESVDLFSQPAASWAQRQNALLEYALAKMMLTNSDSGTPGTATRTVYFAFIDEFETFAPSPSDGPHRRCQDLWKRKGALVSFFNWLRKSRPLLATVSLNDGHHASGGRDDGTSESSPRHSQGTASMAATCGTMAWHGSLVGTMLLPHPPQSPNRLFARTVTQAWAPALFADRIQSFVFHESGDDVDSSADSAQKELPPLAGAPRFGDRHSIMMSRDGFAYAVSMLNVNVTKNDLTDSPASAAPRTGGIATSSSDQSHGDCELADRLLEAIQASTAITTSLMIPVTFSYRCSGDDNNLNQSSTSVFYEHATISLSDSDELQPTGDDGDRSSGNICSCRGERGHVQCLSSALVAAHPHRQFTQKWVMGHADQLRFLRHNSNRDSNDRVGQSSLNTGSPSSRYDVDLRLVLACASASAGRKVTPMVAQAAVSDPKDPPTKVRGHSLNRANKAYDRIRLHWTSSPIPQAQDVAVCLNGEPRGFFPPDSDGTNAKKMVDAIRSWEIGRVVIFPIVSVAEYQYPIFGTHTPMSSAAADSMLRVAHAIRRALEQWIPDELDWTVHVPSTQELRRKLFVPAGREWSNWSKTHTFASYGGAGAQAEQIRQCQQIVQRYENYVKGGRVFDWFARMRLDIDYTVYPFSVKWLNPLSLIVKKYNFQAPGNLFMNDQFSMSAGWIGHALYNDAATDYLNLQREDTTMREWGLVDSGALGIPVMLFEWVMAIWIVTNDIPFTDVPGTWLDQLFWPRLGPWERGTSDLPRVLNSTWDLPLTEEEGRQFWYSSKTKSGRSIYPTGSNHDRNSETRQQDFTNFYPNRPSRYDFEPATSWSYESFGPIANPGTSTVAIVLVGDIGNFFDCPSPGAAIIDAIRRLGGSRVVIFMTVWDRSLACVPSVYGNCLDSNRTAIRKVVVPFVDALRGHIAADEPISFQPNDFQFGDHQDAECSRHIPSIVTPMPDGSYCPNGTVPTDPHAAGFSEYEALRSLEYRIQAYEETTLQGRLFDWMVRLPITIGATEASLLPPVALVNRIALNFPRTNLPSGVDDSLFVTSGHIGHSLIDRLSIDYIDKCWYPSLVERLSYEWNTQQRMQHTSESDSESSQPPNLRVPKAVQLVPDQFTSGTAVALWAIINKVPVVELPVPFS